ncbi:MAG: V-type ATPase subunit [Acholeplasmataceae bacterium]|nr:V-type ATPase subunit [Acholeplasmataceae bacterium]
MSSFSANAISAKAKAMYGKFLKEDHYDRMIKFTTLPELVGFLKKHPNYQDVLRDVNEASVHRGQLEALIKKNAFDNILRLIKIAPPEEADFYRLNIVVQENEVVLALIRTMISQETDDIKGKIPYFFDVHTPVDMKELLKAETFEDLLNGVRKTPYYEILKPYSTRDPQNIRYLDIEHALEAYYYDEAFKRIDRFYTGALNRDLKEVFQTKIELGNITKIYRLKKFYRADPGTIKSVLITTHSRISEKELDRIIAIEDPDAILTYLSSSEYALYTNEKDYVYVEYYAGKIRYDLARKFMYFSTQVPKTYIAFLTLSEIEIDNLTNIIEGIRYQVDEQGIRQMLIY